jgi:hypothetical protein
MYLDDRIGVDMSIAEPNPSVPAEKRRDHHQSSYYHFKTLNELGTGVACSVREHL